MTAEMSAPQRSPAEEAILGLSGDAYRLAAYVLGSAGSAEDVVQQAYLEALARLRSGPPPADARTWFLKIVAFVARTHLRGESRRQRREETVGRQSVAAAGAPAVDAEALAVLRREMAALDPKYRVPVALCCQEGMSQREAAAVLDMPESTVNKYVGLGLEQLRRTLAEAGFAALAAPAGLGPALGALPKPVPPAGLAAKVQALTAAKATSAAAGAALKGGIIVKIGLGIAAAGLVAGGAALIAQPSTIHPASPSGYAAASPPPSTALASPPSAPEKKSKFDIPVWHPDARWEYAGNWAGAGFFGGTLDGPRQEIVVQYWDLPYHSAAMLAFPQHGGPHMIWAYDGKAERFHAVAGSTRGCVDGPFSRARFGGTGYFAYPTVALSPDARYEARTDPHAGNAVRVLDFKEQMVRTVVPSGAGTQSLVINSKGQLLVFMTNGRLRTVDLATGKTAGEITLKATQGLGQGVGRGLALDEKHNRLYVSGDDAKNGKDARNNGSWFVWYFDLNDGGSFHGVLSGDGLGPYAGPFDGYKGYGYGEQTVYFGPDDPDYRFLYMRVTDTSTFMRLDLEKRMVAACSGAPHNQTGPVMFIESGAPNPTTSHMGGIWLPNGDFIMSGIRSTAAPFYRRVK